MSLSPAALRKRLVEDLERISALKTDSVRRAFLSVPRELFVPEFVERDGLEAIYKNVALPTKKDSRGIAISSSSEPSIMARMLEGLKLSPGLKVLEIGTGTGYNAGLLKTLVGNEGEVVTVDLEPELVRKAKARLRKAVWVVQNLERVGCGVDRGPCLQREMPFPPNAALMLTLPGCLIACNAWVESDQTSRF